MKKRKRSLPEIIYGVFLIISFILVFFWFMEQNSRRTEEHNRDYAVDSARLKSEHIDEELDNALNQINTYAYFMGESLTEPVITPQMLERLEKNSQFDAILFTDLDGMDYASDGRTVDVKKRNFYINCWTAN